MSPLPIHGRVSITAGPPVSKTNGGWLATAAPLSVLSPATRLKVHRTPAGRSRSKSYDHCRLSIHLGTPYSGQSIRKGDCWTRGLPSGTIGCEKRATTWRTFFIVPCGEKVTVGAAESAWAAPGAAAREMATTATHTIMDERKTLRVIETKSRRPAACGWPG